MKARLLVLAVLAGFGCEPGIVTEEGRSRSAFDEEQAELAARTGGKPLGRGYVWSGEEAVLSLTLTENGLPTTVEDIGRMSKLERARANLTAAEMKLNRARKRLANLEGPDPELSMLSIRTSTLAAEITRTKNEIAQREWDRQRRRDDLDRIIRWDGTPTLARSRHNLATLEAKLEVARKRLADLESPNPEPLAFRPIALEVLLARREIRELESEQRQWQEVLDRLIQPGTSDPFAQGSSPRV